MPEPGSQSPGCPACGQELGHAPNCPVLAQADTPAAKERRNQQAHEELVRLTEGTLENDLQRFDVLIKEAADDALYRNDIGIIGEAVEPAVNLLFRFIYFRPGGISSYAHEYLKEAVEERARAELERAVKRFTKNDQARAAYRAEGDKWVGYYLEKIFLDLRLRGIQDGTASEKPRRRLQEKIHPPSPRKPETPITRPPGQDVPPEHPVGTADTITRQEIFAEVAQEFAWTPEEYNELDEVVRRIRDNLPAMIEGIAKKGLGGYRGMWERTKGKYADRNSTRSTERLRNFLYALFDTIGHRLGHYAGQRHGRGLHESLRDKRVQDALIRDLQASVDTYIRPFEKVDLSKMLQQVTEVFKKRCASTGLACPEINVELPQKAAKLLSVVTKTGPMAEILLEAMKNAADSEAMMEKFINALRDKFGPHEGKGARVTGELRRQMLDQSADLICDPSGPVRQADERGEQGGSGWLKIPRAQARRTVSDHAIVYPLVERFIAGEYQHWKPTISIRVTPDMPDVPKGVRTITIGIQDNGVGLPRPAWIDQRLESVKGKSFWDQKRRQEVFRIVDREDELFLQSGSTKVGGTGLGLENIINTARAIYPSHRREVDPELESNGPFQGAEIRIRIPEKMEIRKAL